MLVAAPPLLVVARKTIPVSGCVYSIGRARRDGEVVVGALDADGEEVLEVEREVPAAAQASEAEQQCPVADALVDRRPDVDRAGLRVRRRRPVHEPKSSRSTTGIG